MKWHKLTKRNYYSEPVEHIHVVGIMEALEYDRLYENQNNLNHISWKEFDEKYRLGFEFKEDITQISLDQEVIALWFFRERSDRGSTPHLDISGKLFPYEANTIVLTTCKKVTVKEAKRKFIRRPLIQLDLSKAEYDKIIQRVKTKKPKIKNKKIR